ncbi:MAG TPA: hypothetical protein HPP56_05465 [Nitrospirae bacterium]|nr:hypothetical protein [Nitrospirota bacterium]
MRLGVFYSHLRLGLNILDRLRADKLGIILVGNGVYHGCIKENGKKSPLLEKENVNFYALIEDFETRGITADKLDSKVKPVSYSDLVDLIFNDYEKIVWI